MEMVRQMHGIHMAMRLSTEREIFRRPRRLPGLQASKLSLDTALGIDDAISFSDFLNGNPMISFQRFIICTSNEEIYMSTDPLMRPVTAKNGVHELMETNLGI